MAPPVFPTLSALAYPLPRTQSWNTVKQDALSGRRTRTPLYTYPLYKYELKISALSSSASPIGALAAQEWQALEGFIASLQGPAQLFAYNDVNDNAASAQDFGVGDGTTTAFQLVRALGGRAAPVFLINGTPAITVAGTPTSPASISAYGMVNFASAPASDAQLQWTGNFYQPCRFDDDDIDFENFMSTFFAVKSLKFSTEKLP